MQPYGAVFLPIPRSGPLAVLWWATMVGFVGVAGFYTVRHWLNTARIGEDGARQIDPSTTRVFATFFIVAGLAIAIMLLTHVVPGT